MSIRRDDIQVGITFMTDESKAFANTIKDTERFRNELQKAQKEVTQLTKEQERLATQGKDTTNVSLKLAAAEQKVAENLKNIAATGAAIEKIDLSKLLPSQLTQRATQIKQALNFIHDGHPARIQMEQELKAINTQLSDMSARTRGASSAMQQMQTATSPLKSVFDSVFSIFMGGGLIGIITMIAGGIFNIGKSAVKSASDMESLKGTIEVLLKSGAAATKFLKDIQTFATNTPFEFPELAEAGKKLLAFGYSGDAAMKLLKRLGDVATAAQVPIGELSAIVGKAKLGQKIQGEELNQLADRGINIFPELAKVLKTTEDKIKKLGSEGKIAYSDLEKAITLATDKGGKFYGLMDKQSQTFNGLMSTLSDNFGQFAQNVLGVMGERMKPIISGFSKFFETFNKAFEDATPQMTALQTATEAERHTLNATIESVTSYKIGTIERKQAIEQLRAIHPLFMKDLNTETATNEQLRNRLKEVNQQYQAKIIAIAAGKQVEDAINREKTALESVGKERVRQSDNIVKAREFLGDYTSGVDQLVVKLRSEFQNSSWFSSRKEQARDLLNNLKIYKEQNVSLSNLEEGASKRTLDAKNREKLVIQELKKQYPEIAQQLDLIAKAAEGTADANIKAQKSIASAVDPKEAKKAEDERLKRVKDALELELKDKEIFFKREEVINELAYEQKLKTESDFNKMEIEINRDKYTALIKVYDTYQNAFSSKSEEFKNIEIKKLELQRKIIAANTQLAPRNVQELETLGKRQNTEGVKSQIGEALSKIQANADIEKSLVRRKFGELLTMEQQFEIKKLEIQSEAFQRQLEVLKANGATETEEYKRIAKAKETIDKTVVDEKKRLADIEKSIEQSKQEIYQNTFTVAADLLTSNLDIEKQKNKEKSDSLQKRMDELEKAGKKESSEYKQLQKDKEAVDKEDLAMRKERGKAIKAFQIAQIVTNGILEVQKIWATVAEYGPASPIIGAILTGLTVARTAVSVNRVKAQQFASGGIAALKSGIFGGQPHSNGGTKGYFEDGTTIEVEKGEAFAVVNKRNTPLLRALSVVNAANGNGKPYFADGGVMNLNTSPIGFNNSATPSVQIQFDTQSLGDKLDKLTTIIATQQTQMKAYITIDDLEAKQKSVAQDRSDAAY